MDLSKRWLHDFVDLDVSDKEFADRITLSGSKVECWSTEGAQLSNIVVGKVLTTERHPDSDHLWVCSVDVGSGEPVQIVTGAQNVNAGDFVPAALNNSVVAGGKSIKKGKLRGVESDGMLCSLGELGLTVHDFPYAIEDGIFILGEDCTLVPGTDIREATGFNDVVTEFEITPNRPDCLSITGLARETAVTFGKEFKYHEPAVKPGSKNVADYLKVDILNPDKCFRYVGAVVENVRIKPSPRWIRERLRACGVRPINNIVDITNFVMIELGQPMHAFDLRFLKGNHVIVRNAKNGESITTLDGTKRTLGDNMLVIADEEKPVAVAGVMGGEYSGIMDDTNTVVFESACFSGPSVRITAKKLGMRTESSGRFEKGLDPRNCLTCLKRALELVQLLDAGDVMNGFIDCDVSRKQPTKIPFDPEWVNSYIGIVCPAEEQKRILEALDFTVEDGMITVPSFRGDVELNADISEEIARFYGYDKIPDAQLTGVAAAKLTPAQKFRRTLDNALLACGLDEICTYSFITPKSYDRIRLPENSPLRKCVVISNPLGEDTSVMRTTSIPSMLDVLARNYNNRNKEARLYENATVYRPVEGNELPDETDKIAIGIYGQGCDYFTIKGIIDDIFDIAGMTEYDIEALRDDPTWHPGHTARILDKDGCEFAVLGQIHPDVAENYGVSIPLFCAEIDINTLFEKGSTKRVYRHLPRFPALTRDLAFVCDRNIPVLKLEKLIAGAIGKTLEHIELFDVYQGEQIAADKKSAAFSIRLRAADRTLTDEEADSAVKKAIKALSEIGAVLRG